MNHLPSRQHFFDDLATRWESMQSPEREQKLRGLIARSSAGWPASGTILDAGTGRGALLPVLTDYFPDAKVTGMDLSHAMLTGAKSRAAGKLLIQADASDLPFTPSTFDVIIAHALIPHLPDPVAALRGFAAVLKPGGALLILHDSSRETVNAIHQRVGGAIGEDRAPEAAVLQEWLAEAGYTTITIEDTPEHYLALAQNPGIQKPG